MVMKKTPLNTLKVLEICVQRYKCKLNRKHKLIKKMSDPTGDQWSPLHIAVHSGHLKLFKELLPKVVNKNPPNDKGETPLHTAVKCGHLDICRLIIEQLDEKNPADKIGFTPLHYAAMNGCLDIYQLIVQNVDEKNPADEFGITPLHCGTTENNRLAIMDANGIPRKIEEELSLRARVKLLEVKINELMVDLIEDRDVSRWKNLGE